MRLAAVLPPVLLAAASLAALALPARRTMPTTPRHVAPEAVALLGGLRAGDHVGGAEVLSVGGPVDGVVEIELQRGAAGFSVYVARRERLHRAAPRTTHDYAVYYGHPVPRDAAIPTAAYDAALDDVARRVRAHEAQARAAVPGM